MTGATLAPASQVVLSWQDNATDETGFKIERAIDGVSFAQVATVDANVNSFNDTTVAAATTYSFRIRAYNAAGDSAYSNVAIVTTPAVAPTNTPPTISNLTDCSIAEDTNTGSLAFTIADNETAAGSLTLTVGSSNGALVPSTGFVLGGSGGSRTLTVTPTANQNGTATITVTVSDGTLTTSDSFVVTVMAVNDAPTISKMGDRTINAGTGTGAINFTVGDIEAAAGSLALSGTSSNALLVPVGGIEFGGTGSSRTVTVTPAAGQSGSATITVTVSDGGLTASDSFVLSVSAVNEAPTVSDLTDLAISEDNSTGARAFTVADTQTASGSLVVTASSSNPTLAPASALVLGGSGANRTLAVAPAANQSGSATITVIVSDGVLTATDSFVLTVNAVNDAPIIGAIADRTIERGSTTGTVNFTISDVETPATSLVLTVTSSNPTLVPATSITLGGSGSDRTITIVPVATESGTATITLAASDGVLSTTRAFTLTVTFASQVLVSGDIGAPRLAGSTTFSNGVFTILASGADIGGIQDSFHFARQEILGDAELIVRVGSLIRTSSWARAGLMFRSSLAANASNVGLFVTPDRGVILQARSAAGATTTKVYGLTGKAPEWLRLIRTADTFLAYRSENGLDWEFVEMIDVAMPGSIYGGLAVTSCNQKKRTTATFDSFEVD